MFKIGKTDLPILKAKKGKNEHVSLTYLFLWLSALAATAFLHLAMTATKYSKNVVILGGKVLEPFLPLLQKNADSCSEIFHL